MPFRAQKLMVAGFLTGVRWIGDYKPSHKVAQEVMDSVSSSLLGESPSLSMNEATEMRSRDFSGPSNACKLLGNDTRQASVTAALPSNLQTLPQTEYQAGINYYSARLGNFMLFAENWQLRI